MGRSKYQCHFNGCPSTAEFEGHVTIWYKGLDGRPVPLEMKSTAHVCGHHRIALTRSLTSERAKEQMANQLTSNFGPPDFDSLTVEFKEIQREKTVLELGTRRIVTCDRVNMEGDAPEPCIFLAKWQVVLMVRSHGDTKKTRPKPVLLNFCVCNKHRKDMKVEDFTDPRTKSQLVGQLVALGFPMPNFKLMELTYEEMIDGRRVDPAKFMRDRSE